jgi:drug/metabolite transporter (DMT)-like permease
MKSKSLFFLFLSMILIWGAGFPTNKVGLSHTTPTHFIELRLLIALLTVLILTLATKNFAFPKKVDLPILIAVGVFQIGLTLIFSTYGLSLVETGKATFIIYTTPIWIILITGLLNKRMTLLDFLGLICGLIGTLSLIDPWKFHSSEYSSWAGALFLVLSALAWSIGIIATHRLKWHSSPQRLLLWVPIIALVISHLFLNESITMRLIASISLILLGILLHIYSEWKTHHRNQDLPP